jgi:hypothetical protein
VKGFEKVSRGFEEEVKEAHVAPEGQDYKGDEGRKRAPPHQLVFMRAHWACIVALSCRYYQHSATVMVEIVGVDGCGWLRPRLLVEQSGY